MILEHIDNLIIEVNLGFKRRAEAKSYIRNERRKRAFNYVNNASFVDKVKILSKGMTNAATKPKTMASIIGQATTGLDIPGMIDAVKTIRKDPSVLKHPKEVLDVALGAAPGQGGLTALSAVIDGTAEAVKQKQLQQRRQKINTMRDIYPHLTNMEPSYAT